MKIRDFNPGMGQAVAERTILRNIDGKTEGWGDVATRVAAGNVSLAPGGLVENVEEFVGLHDHIAAGRILMSGRHLQHGDLNQPFRNMETFTNCATAASSFLSLYLLLNGSGVGRCYDDDMMLVDWDDAPSLHLILRDSHKDSNKETLSDIEHYVDFLISTTRRPVVHQVQDSREGWAKALEIYETMTYRKESDKVLVLDFSDVRPSGSPIGGMQGRPASGPVPLMDAFKKIRDNVVGRGWPRWKQAMHVDHYMADCVLVGGVRRAARIATKYWQDPDILEFISIKKDGDLWSANNSVGVDEEFWETTNTSQVHIVNTQTKQPPEPDWRTIQIASGHLTVVKTESKAVAVFNAITSAAYYDNSGEPGFLNLHKLNFNEEGLDWEELKKGEYVGSSKYRVEDSTKSLLGALAGCVEHKKHKAIVNPCGEIVLSVLGGFCVIADVVPFHCEDQYEFEDACRHAVRSLLRVNTMDNIYSLEVRRTNRIGVGITGLHEWAWMYHGWEWEGLGTHNGEGLQEALEAARYMCQYEADVHAAALGVSSPHTVTTIKPAGTTSKLFGLTEGCHLPAMGYYMRWVQFKSDDPLVADYASRGYPTKVLKTYSGMTAVGFPTKPAICDLGMGDSIVFAADATMGEQFAWIKMLEEHWLGPTHGNQLSYTMKYKPWETSYEQFQGALLKHMPDVRCVSVMPQIDTTAYEYQPEEAITEDEYNEWMQTIQHTTEDIGLEHVECGSGGCPVDFTEGEK